MKKLLFLFVFGLNLVVVSNAMKRAGDPASDEPDIKRQCFESDWSFQPDEDVNHGEGCYERIDCDKDNWPADTQALDGEEADDSRDGFEDEDIKNDYKETDNKDGSCDQDTDPCSSDIEMEGLNCHDARCFTDIIKHKKIEDNASILLSRAVKAGNMRGANHVILTDWLLDMVEEEVILSLMNETQNGVILRTLNLALEKKLGRMFCHMHI